MPSASCCFLPVLVFQNISTKRSQNATKLFGDFFTGHKRPWKLRERARRWSSGPQGTRARLGGRGAGAPWWLVGPCYLRLTYFQLHKFSKIGKPTKSHPKHFLRRRKSLFLRDPTWGPPPVICRRGNWSRKASTSTLLPYRWCVSSLPQTYGSIASS